MRRPLLTLLALVALAASACGAAEPDKKPEGKPDAAKPAAGASAAAPDASGLTEEQKTVYAIGLAISQNLVPLALSEAELDVLKQGLTAGVLDRGKLVDLQVYGPKIQVFAQGRQQAAAEAEKKAGAEFLEKAAKEKGARKTASGMVVQEIKAGSGESPSATDTVKVHYHGTLADGSVFDSSVDRGQPIDFPLNGVIPCWTEGVQTMKVGGKSRLVCPANLAYGDRGSPPKIKPGATLVFDVELLEVKKAAAPAAAPAPSPASGQ